MPLLPPPPAAGAVQAAVCRLAEQARRRQGRKQVNSTASIQAEKEQGKVRWAGADGPSNSFELEGLQAAAAHSRQQQLVLQHQPPSTHLLDLTCLATSQLKLL